MNTKTTYNLSYLYRVFKDSQNVQEVRRFVLDNCKKPVDIIIPIYNGYEFLEKLFSSLLKNTSIPYRLLVCDDNSSDERVFNYLSNLRENISIPMILEKNSKNLGFVKTVNKMVKFTENHFVILNTDTEVPPFWLERMIYPIYAIDMVASVTPFSNAGSICSFPNCCEDNPLFLDLPVEKIDKYFQTICLEKTFEELPSGVGFCMAINREVYEKIGLFDEIFGKGYGEENDWCMRARKIGYRNIIATNLFVYHKHGGSFGRSLKVEILREKNLQKVINKHPDYGTLVSDFITRDPLKFLRDILKILILSEVKGYSFLNSKDYSMGTNIYRDGVCFKIYGEEKSEERIIVEVFHPLLPHGLSFHGNRKHLEFMINMLSTKNNP